MFTIHDPIHGLICFDEKNSENIKSIIESPLFRRLRNIRQLGLAEFVFPSATHSRFSHSIGTAYVSSKIFKQLKIILENEGNSSFRDEYINNFDKLSELSILSSLIHDIGHGPFSHLFEKCFEKKEIEKIKHEDWTKSFVNDLTKRGLIKTDINTEDIINIITGSKSDGELPSFLLNITSSHLDADRMDYLLRDSYFCGVSYGKYDLDWLISNITIAFTNYDKKEEHHLGVKYKGLGIAEHYLSARRQMTRNVYFHKKIKAAEFILQNYISLLIEHIDELDKLLLNGLGKFSDCTDIGKFLKLSNKYLKGSIIKNDFISDSYDYYKKLCNYDILYICRVIYDNKDKLYSSNIKSLFELSKRLIERKIPYALLVPKENIDNVKNCIDKFKKSHKNCIKDWELHFDNNTTSTYKTDKNNKLFLIEDDHKACPIEEDSKILGMLNNSVESSSFIYIDKDFVEKDICNIKEFVTKELFKFVISSDHIKSRFKLSK
jgi:uncharacterized protein